MEYNFILLKKGRNEGFIFLILFIWVKV